MSLKDLYDNAAANTYVGTVRTKQSSTAPTNTNIVNFMDGTRRTAITPDKFQTEFTRNDPNAYVAGGIPKHTGGQLTRWTSTAFKLAFDGEGPASLLSGYYTSQFRTAYRAGANATQLVHNYTPTKKFGTENQSARFRIGASPSGAPGGL